MYLGDGLTLLYCVLYVQGIFAHPPPFFYHAYFIHFLFITRILCKTLNTFTDLITSEFLLIQNL